MPTRYPPIAQPMAPTLMTEAEFKRFIASGRTPIYVYPYAVALCSCGDVNCHGWRLVPRGGVRPVAVAQAREFATT